MAATIVKTEQLNNTALIKSLNYDYLGAISVFMDDCTPSEALQEAIDNCGWDIGDVPTTGMFKDLDCEVTAIEAIAQSDTKVQVLVRFGMPQVPITFETDSTIKWVYETHTATRQIQSAIDGTTDKAPIVVKYRPRISAAGVAPAVYMADADWNKPYAQRRFVRQVTATKYMPWTTAYCRARIHRNWDLKNPNYKSTILAGLLGGTYNDAVTLGGVTIKARQWMCQGVNCTTPNQGIIHNVDVTLIFNPYGWDPYIMFVDPVWNAIPAEIADALKDPANADLLTPDHEALTEPAANPFGVKRPYMAQKYNYASPPIGIDLAEIIGV